MTAPSPWERTAAPPYIAGVDDDDRAAKLDIAEVLVRYSTGIDRRDWDLFRTCFTDDCHCDYGDIGVWEGVDAITDFMVAAHAGMGHTMHRLSNIAIAVRGDRAEARTYIDAVLLTPEGQTGLNALGFYDDELVRVEGGWRIARRRYTPTHFRTISA
jgi:3-phenylpropionate/cinnamic acid dioxygenase small subunit